MSAQATAFRVWTLKTSGQNSTQVTSGAAVLDFFGPELGTMPLLWPFVTIERLPVVQPQELEVAQRLSAADLELRKGLLGLLSFRFDPDQPTDEDIRPRLEYNLPA
jgi:hypothetical protein